MRNKNRQNTWWFIQMELLYTRWQHQHFRHFDIPEYPQAYYNSVLLMISVLHSYQLEREREQSALLPGHNWINWSKVIHLFRLFPETVRALMIWWTNNYNYSLCKYQQSLDWFVRVTLVRCAPGSLQAIGCFHLQADIIIFFFQMCLFSH